ncbi:Vomeronasal 2, receptor 84 [Apodemus speciosus]|uniref:Vomeronasal 2, receptor 84 n=1 Tax=Apodemus speciosus TaxID=105296 RepID=A0ABQ0FGJ7_APOSI
MIKNTEDSGGDLRNDCGFTLWTMEEPSEENFYKEIINFRVSLCSPGCPGTHSVEQAGLELRNPSASASKCCVFFGPFNPNLSDHDRLPYVHQIATKDTHLCHAMVSLMLHFGWTWIGLVISDNDQGIQFLSDLREEIQRHGICLAFVNVIPESMEIYRARAKIYDKQIMTSSAKVVIIYGEMNSTLEVSFRRWEYLSAQRIWITTSQWDVITNKKEFSLDFFHGTVTFAHHTGEIPKFRNFMQTMNTDKYPVNIFESILRWNYFNCSVSKNSNKMEDFNFNNTLEWTELHKYDMTLSEEGYNLYNAVYAVAYTYHELIFQQVESQKIAETKGIFTDCQQIQQLHISEDVEWATGGTPVPSSVCSVPCTAGFRKIHWKETVDCCFDCVHCPENEVSNETDMEQCMRCPDDKYANLEQTHCLQRAITFLAYEDPLGIALGFTALSFSAITILVLVTFVKYKDTPIVKANNLIPATSCSSLYCILQQITFGVFFTVAVSTVLAKTITVVMALKLTTPGRRMRGMLTSGAPNLVIPICTLIQVVLCGIWFVTSPPLLTKI